MSGAAARSSYYIGFIETLKKYNIPIDYIAAQSGATIVSAAFACGTLDYLKNFLTTADSKTIRSLLDRKGASGLYSLDRVEERLRNDITKHATFEEVNPKLFFMAADLERGEAVVLAMGDLARAARISCSIPGLFEPVMWGNRVLVDGGLISYLPSNVVRDAGADIVIGVSVRATRHIFYQHQLLLKDWYNKVKQLLFVKPKQLVWEQAGKILKTDQFADYLDSLRLLEQTDPEAPGLFTVLGKSLDLAIEAAKHTSKASDPTFGCDILIRQGLGGWGDAANVSQAAALYHEGLAAGEEYVPKILEVIRRWKA